MARSTKRSRALNDSDDESNAAADPQPARRKGKARMSIGPALVAMAAASSPGIANTSARDAVGLPPPQDPATSASSEKKKKPKKKRVSLDQIFGFGDLADGGKMEGSVNSRKRDKPIEAVIKLGKHQQGDKKGQYTGRAFFAMNCDFGENKAFAVIVEEVLKCKPQWFKDWSMWGVRCTTAAFALKLFNAIKASDQMKVTARRMNKELDLSPFEDPAVNKYEFTLAYSETQFETRADGVLPRSIMLIGKTYDWKDHLKEQFPTIRYSDLIFNGGKVTKAAWVLAEEDQTAETGTMADFLESNGATVTEVDLDDDEDEDDDAERDEDGFLDDEAEEVDEDED